MSTWHPAASPRLVSAEYSRGTPRRRCDPVFTEYLRPRPRRRHDPPPRYGLSHADDSDDDAALDAAPLAPGRAVARTAADAPSDFDDAPLLCSHALFGHGAAVTAVAYSATLDCVVSADAEGTALIHAARSGRRIRRLEDVAGGAPATVLAILDADVCVACAAATELAVWSLNGDRRATATLDAPLKSLAAPRANTVLVCGGADGVLSVRRTFDLALVHAVDLSAHGAPLFLAFGADDRHLLAATAGGRVVVCSDPKSRLLQLDAALSNTVIGLDAGLFAF